MYSAAPHVVYYFRRRYKFTANYSVDDGQKLNIDGMEFTAIYAPAHTAGSVRYILVKLLFIGDTIIDEI